MPSAKIYMSPSCTANCSELNSEDDQHEGSHTEVQRKNIVDKIEEVMFRVLGTEWSNLVKCIAKMFEEVRKQLKALQTRVFEDLKKQKMKFILNTTDYELIDIALQIADMAKDQVEGRCCDVSNIHKLLSATNQTFQFEALKIIEQETVEEIEKGIMKLSSLTSTLNNPEGLEQLNEMNFFKIEPKGKQLRTIKIDMVPSELPTARFNVHIKVIKIIKRFALNEVHKVVFMAGDETGIAECVMTDHPLIKQKQTIFATNCKTYVFKNTKQIQSCQNSVISKRNEEKKYVNKANNISIKMDDKKAYKIKRKTAFEHHQKVSSKKKQKNEAPKKIQFLSPEDQQINITAELLSFDQDCEKSLKCLMGDDTAIIKVIFPLFLSSQLSEGKVYNVKNVDVVVDAGKLMVVGGKKTKVNSCKEKFTMINSRKNLSTDHWIPRPSRKVEEKIQEVEEGQEESLLEESSDAQN